MSEQMSDPEFDNVHQRQRAVQLLHYSATFKLVNSKKEFFKSAD